MKKIKITNYRKTVYEIELDGKTYEIKELYGANLDRYIDALDDMQQARAEANPKATVEVATRICKIVLCEANGVPVEIVDAMSPTVIGEVLDPFYGEVDTVEKKTVEETE